MTFLLYDEGNNPVGQYTSDNQGYVYIENIETGRYYLRELENEGYILDTQAQDGLCKVRRDNPGGVGEHPHHGADPDHQEVCGR